MEVQVGYKEGHLVVAAVRVLTHQHAGRPPTVEEISKLLGLSREWAGVLVSGLEKTGIVRALTGPFETRVEIADHTRLEKLPRGETAGGVDEELKEFSKKKQEEEEKLRGLFTGGDAERKRKDKMGKLADELKGWKPKPPKSAPFMKEPEDG